MFVCIVLSDTERRPAVNYSQNHAGTVSSCLGHRCTALGRVGRMVGVVSSLDGSSGLIPEKISLKYGFICVHFGIFWSPLPHTDKPIKSQNLKGLRLKTAYTASSHFSSFPGVVLKHCEQSSGAVKKSLRAYTVNALGISIILNWKFHTTDLEAKQSRQICGIWQNDLLIKLKTLPPRHFNCGRSKQRSLLVLNKIRVNRS